MRVQLRVAIAVGLALLFAVSGTVAGALSLPFISLPEPMGAELVGTTVAVVGQGIGVQLWYPARSRAGSRRAAYRPDARARALRERMIFPFVRTAAFVDAPVAGGTHGVVLYLPGWGGRRSENTALCENLASRGLVVAAIDDLWPSPEMDFSSRSAYEATRRWADKKVALMSAAARGVLTALQRLSAPNAAASVVRTIDFGRVAVVGYSFGGATAAEMAIDDRRVRAAVNLDGWTFGAAARNGVNKPFMIVGTGAPTVNPPANERAESVPSNVYEAELDRQNGRQILDGFNRYGGYNITIDGTQHESFCDDAVLPFLLRDAVPGAIDSRRAARIVATYVGDFTDFVLNGRRSELLSQPAGRGMITRRSELDRAALVTTWNLALTARRSNS